MRLPIRPQIPNCLHGANWTPASRIEYTRPAEPLARLLRSWNCRTSTIFPTRASVCSIHLRLKPIATYKICICSDHTSQKSAVISYLAVEDASYVRANSMGCSLWEQNSLKDICYPQPSNRFFSEPARYAARHYVFGRT